VAAANAVLDVIEEENLCARALEMGARMTGRLEELARRQGFECIGDVRGLGAMVAMELVQDRASKAPDPTLTAALVAEAQERGLVLLSCGT
nr:aminotransferase class III-fold pyridoxal phosphate-dependent enzyme [Shewanella ferrihydritica]